MKHPERVALFAMLAAMAVAPLAPGHGALKGSRAKTDEAQLQSQSPENPAWQTRRADTDDVAPPRATPDARALRSESSGDMSRDATRDTLAPGTSPSRVAPSGETPASRGFASPGRFSYQQR